MKKKLTQYCCFLKAICEWVDLLNLIFLLTMLSYGGEPVLCFTITVPSKLSKIIICALDQYTDSTF